jgi:hypothetical protein
MASGFSESGINIYVPIQDDAAANNDDLTQPYRLWIHHNKSHNNQLRYAGFDGNGLILDNLGDLPSGNPYKLVGPAGISLSGRRPR